MDIDFEYYRVFYYVAKYGNFSRAAEKLYVSQPAISQIIKKLEEQLGENIFFRNRDGICLTEAGKQLYYLVETSVIMLENANKKFAQFANLEMGKINIRTGNTIAEEILSEPLAKFMKLYPNIKFEISSGSNSESLKMLSQGEVDMVLMNCDYKREFSNIEITKCFDKEFIFVMSKEYQEKHNVEIKEFNDLKKYNLILPKNKSTVRKILELEYEEAKEIENDSQITSEELKIDLVKNGCGITIIEKNLVKNEIRKGTLVKIELPKKIKGYCGFATVNKESMSIATKKLTEMILEYCKNTY